MNVKELAQESMLGCISELDPETLSSAHLRGRHHERPDRARAPDTLLVTSLNNNQLIRVAELMDVPGICLVSGWTADPC